VCQGVQAERWLWRGFIEYAKGFPGRFGFAGRDEDRALVAGADARELKTSQRPPGELTKGE